MSGWIALWRKFDRHPDWQEPRVFSKAEAWIYLLMKANWAPSVDSHGDVIERGEVCTSTAKLMKDWQWSKGKVLRQLAIWKRDPQIDLKTDRKRTVIRIMKYDEYQAVSDHTDPKPIRKRNDDRSTNGLHHNNKQQTSNNKQEDQDLGTPSENEVLMLPIHLETPAFRAALGDWINYKRERRESYKPLGLQALIRKLGKLGATRAVAAIEFSMEQNYAGIFEPRGGNQRQTPADRLIELAMLESQEAQNGTF